MADYYRFVILSATPLSVIDTGIIHIKQLSQARWLAAPIEKNNVNAQ